MKYILITKLLLFMPLNLIGHSPDINNFLKFVSKGYIAPESVKRICVWQYAIVKVQTDFKNTIINYQIENKVSEEMIKSFNFLIGYKFNSTVLSNKNIFFFLSLESQRVDNCDVSPSNIIHEKAESIMKRYKSQHSKSNPKSIFIDNVITQIIYDPVY